MDTGNRTILVVEDNQETADLFSEILSVSGYTVIQSTSSSQAKNIIVEELPDALVLDIMMPEESGLEVLRFIRSTKEISQIPVVVVSAKGTPLDIAAGLAAGANLYLTKPVSFDELRKAVRSVLE